MLNKIQRTVKRFTTAKEEYILWKENDQLRELQPTRLRAKIVIAAMGPNGLSTRDKVNPKRFSHHFAECWHNAASGPFT